VLQDSFNTYTWDAEGKNVSTTYSTTSGQVYTFVYDAFGHKVEWSSNGSYIESYLMQDKIKLTAIGQTPFYYEFPLPGGGVLSRGSGATGVQLGDWLGTIRAFYSFTGGSLGQTGAHAPFGESYAYSSGYPGTFTGESNNGFMNNTTYYFQERQYRSSQGRWLTPDPAGLAAVNPGNPQSWNRYAYVMNNPLNSVDALGLCGPEIGDDHTCPSSYADASVFGFRLPGMIGGWDEFDLLVGIYACGRNGDCGHYRVDDVGLLLRQAERTANNGKSICSGAAGKTIPVNAPFGQMRFQFDGSGNLIGLGLQLTGMNGVSGNGLSIPPNTFAGFTQLSPGTVQFGFSNPVNVGSGFSQAYVQTATFSGGRYTSVQGAYAPLGIPLGSSSGNSSLLQWFLNGNSSTASQAQNFGNLMTSFASLVSRNVSCQAVLGGG
jgi:RHS repeat-associated protein